MPLVLREPALHGGAAGLAGLGRRTGRGAAARLAGDASRSAPGRDRAARLGGPRCARRAGMLASAGGRGRRRLSDAGFFRLLDEFRLTAREAALKD